MVFLLYKKTLWLFWKSEKKYSNNSFPITYISRSTVIIFFFPKKYAYINFSAKFVFLCCFLQVLQVATLCVTSKYDWSLLTSRFKEQSVMLKRLSDPNLASDIAFIVQPENLYDHFDIQLRDLEVTFLPFYVLCTCSNVVMRK